MGGKITPRPAVQPKCTTETTTAKETKPKPKPEAAIEGSWKLGNKIWQDDWLAPAATSDKQQPQSKPAGTYQKVESVWKQGNVTGTDDWEKHTP
ncbi:MAG: hypothetical protein JNK82_38645 [Myxococcaceae bacterium]|nr:hypothetical protein [Myxococcaceae bacterium]